jgi:hypothetical protein
MFVPQDAPMPRLSSPCGLLAAIALTLPGCGGDEGFRFPVHPTGGKVLRTGKPLARAIVRFHPTDPTTIKIPDGRQGPPLVLTTTTDAEGAFALSTYLADDGVPLGEYAVTVATGLAETDVEEGVGLPAKVSRDTSTSARNYGDPATTPLKATVKPGENRFTFELD